MKKWALSRDEMIRNGHMRLQCFSETRKIWKYQKAIKNKNTFTTLRIWTKHFVSKNTSTSTLLNNLLAIKIFLYNRKHNVHIKTNISYTLSKLGHKIYRNIYMLNNIKPNAPRRESFEQFSTKIPLEWFAEGKLTEPSSFIFITNEQRRAFVLTMSLYSYLYASLELPRMLLPP